jgi:hypothetical protein
MVAAALLGIFLIAVSVPFLSAFDEGKTYTITWSQAEAGSAQAASGASGSTTTVRVPVADVLSSNATIEVESCTDAGQAPLSQPATITWTLYRGDAEVEQGRGIASCANQGPFRVALHARPDVAQVQASSLPEAEELAYGAGGTTNETVEYRLEFQWSRPAAPGGLPLPPPAFSATVSLTIETWTATANDPDQEVPR